MLIYESLKRADELTLGVHQHFRRDAFGAWLCIAQATLDLPTGRIQVTPGSKFTQGTTFMNVDLAMLLEKQYQKDQNPGLSRHAPCE